MPTIRRYQKYLPHSGRSTDVTETDVARSEVPPSLSLANNALLDDPFSAFRRAMGTPVSEVTPTGNDSKRRA